MMFIEQITLQNIKSYGPTPVAIQFKEGVNLIAGANGAGKSTILEAIGFVLFDALPYSQSDFKRRNKSGSTKITIRLHSAYDNRVYDVERTIPGRYKVIDVQEHIDEGIQSKDDLLEWLCQHLKIENKEDLTSLFENAVGVQQGTITAVFLENARARKVTFDSLLRVQDFEHAWNELGETRKYIADLLNHNTNEITHKEGQTERLTELETSVETTRKDIAGKEKELENIVGKFKTLKITLEQLDQHKTRLDQLKHQIKQTNMGIEHLEKSLATAQENYDQSQSASQIITENEEVHRLHNEANVCLQELEAQRKKRDELVAEQSSIKEQLNVVKQQLDQINKDLAEVGAAEAQFIELEPLVEQQGQLEKEQAQALDKQKERNRLQEQVKDDSKRLKTLKSELKTLHEDVEQRQQLDEHIQQHNQNKDEIAKQIGDLSAKRPTLETTLENAQKIFNDAHKQFQEHERLQETIQEKGIALEEAENDWKKIGADLEARKVLEGQVAELDKQITLKTGDQTTAEHTIKRVEQALDELQSMREILGGEGSVCPVCRRSMGGAAHTEAVDYYDTQERKLNDEREKSQSIISGAQESIEAWRSQKTSAENQRDKLANQVALTNIVEQIEVLRAEFSNLQAECVVMEDIPQARIDVEAALRDAHNTLDQHDSHVNELTTEREQLTEKIADLRGQMVDLSSKDELERREVEYNDLVKDIETSGTRFSELKDIDEEVRQLNDELAVLKNPRERQAIAQNTVNKRGTLATNRQQQQELADTAQSEYETVQEKLKAYATLDANLEAARTQRDDHAEGYHLYVENKKTAELLNERTERLNDVQAKLAEETDKRDEYVQECDKLAKDFDVEHYVALQEEHRELETIQTELRAESKHLSEKLSETETEIDKLHAIVAQIKTLQEIGKRLTEEQMTFEFVRKSIRDAGPRIRKRKVQLVSEVAANYFSEIINDFTMRLQWDADDYGIHLEQGGETRPFGVLSGGEQMIAALAVRLALLTHMTQVRLIFLDEPTINLDKNRRIQLAERLSTIKGLKQLFVISHDDTFIGDSNHVINVIKEDEISRVEMSHATLY